MSQADLVRALKERGWSSVYQNTVSRIEKGERPVRYGEARVIARALGVNIELFLLSAADSQTAIALAAARERLGEAHRDTYTSAKRWLEVRDELERQVSDAVARGITATELPENEDETLVATTVGDELALAMDVLDKQTIESSVYAARYVHNLKGKDE